MYGTDFMSVCCFLFSLFVPWSLQTPAVSTGQWKLTNGTSTIDLSLCSPPMLWLLSGVTAFVSEETLTQFVCNWLVQKCPPGLFRFKGFLLAFSHESACACIQFLFFLLLLSSVNKATFTQRRQLCDCVTVYGYVSEKQNDALSNICI